ncbi:MAG: hypothetical protein ABEJ83_03570, partial [Candidatus Nanohaloarchaea archaeon]
MNKTSKIRRLTVFALTLTFLTGLTAAVWTIEDVDSPASPENISQKSSSMQMVRILDSNGNPVNSSDMEENWNYYRANLTGYSQNITMSHLSSGYWTVEIPESASLVNTSNITYELENAPSELNFTEEIHPGNLSTTALKLGEKQQPETKVVEPGTADTIELKVVDSSGNTVGDNASVSVYFTNGSWSSPKTDLGYSSSENVYSNQITYPDSYNNSYYLHAKLSMPLNQQLQTPYQYPYGLKSVKIKTKPRLHLKLKQLAASNACNNQSFFNACSSNAEIHAEINTTSDITEVDMALKAKDSGTWKTLKMKQMNRTGSMFTANLTIPVLNTTKYSSNMQLRFNSTGKYQEINHSLQYRSFKMNDLSSSVSNPGNYKVKFEVLNYFTPNPIDPDRLSGQINIYNSTGTEYTSFNLSQMKYDTSNGFFHKNIQIPVGDEGLYTKEITVENNYGKNKTITSRFNITQINQTFTAEDDIDTEIMTKGNHTYRINLTPEVQTQLTINTSISDEIENMTTVNNGEQITLSEHKQVNVTFNITELGSYEGEITFTDTVSQYNETIDVDITGPECQERTENLCLGVENLDIKTDQRKTIKRLISVEYIGYKNQNLTVTPGTTGNISQLTTLNPQSFTLNQQNRSKTVEANFTVQKPGNFTGNITIENATMPVELEADVTPQNLELAAPPSIDLGNVVKGSTVTETVTLENTGTLDIKSLSYNSKSLSVTGPDKQIPAGETKDIELTISDLTDSGTITIEAANQD